MVEPRPGPGPGTSPGSAPRSAAHPSRQGLVELLLVTGFLVVAAAGAVALFGDELRQTFGGRGAAPASSPGPAAGPSQPAPPR